MIDVIIDNRIRIREESLPEDVARELREKFERKNPQAFMLRKKGLRSWSVPPILKGWRRESDDLTFPRGAWSLVKPFLAPLGYRTIDRRAGGVASNTLDHFVEVRDYQEEALAEGLRRENCILRASTGSGKTTLGLAVAASVSTFALVVVDTREIAEEWARRCRKELEVEPGKIGEGKFRVERVTIAMHQTLAAMGPDRLRKVCETFGCVIADEVQICGAETYGRNIDRMPARYRIGLSDDHRRADGKSFLVTDLFGPVAHWTKDKRLLADGAIAELDVFLDPTDFEAPWYVNRPEDEKGDPIPPTAQEEAQLIEEMTYDDRRSARIAARVAEEIGKGQRFLVYAHRTEHCRRIAALLIAAGVPTGLMLGGTDEFDRTRSGLMNGTVKAGVGTYQALGKGVNIPDVDAGYAATMVVTTPQRWRQAAGRVRRAKEDGRGAKFWVAYDGKVFGDAPVRKLVAWHRNHVFVRVGHETLSPREYAARLKGKESTYERPKGEAAG